MSTNFKATIRNRYKGRGNCWVKVPNDSVVFQTVVNSLSNVDASEYLGHIDREGFAWVRFSKPAGNQQEPLVTYEVRYRGSKFDHPDNLLIVSHSVSKDFPLLGNTPVKLAIEVLPENRKLKQPVAAFKRKVTKSSEEVIEDFQDVEQEIRIIKEAALTKPSNRELENWYEFLKLNGLYEENV